MAARIRGVLFDVAGTLLMPEDGAAWLRGGLDTVGVSLDDGAQRALIAQLEAAGRPGGPYPAAVPDAAAGAYARRDLDQETHRDAYVALLSSVELPHPRLAEVLYERIRQPECWVPYADALSIVRALRRRGLALGAVSNVGFDLRPVLEAHGVLPLLDACLLSCDLGVAKPDARIFAAACAALGTAPGETLMVGDHPEADGAGAVAAGLQSLVLPMTPPGSVHGLNAVLAAL